jgi:hypothetical protein
LYVKKYVLARIKATAQVLKLNVNFSGENEKLSSVQKYRQKAAPITKGAMKLERLAILQRRSLLL